MGNEQQKNSAERSVRITDAAHKNHEELFPNHKSILKVTDPELIELFDNFAFDEVIAHGELDTKTRVILILASNIGSQAVSEYKVMVAAALNVGITPIEIKEILYQSVPYVGMAKAFDFVHATNEVLTGRGILGQSTTNPENRYDQGWQSRKRCSARRSIECTTNLRKTNCTFKRFCLPIASAIFTRVRVWT
jgi:4-carboxymuconolactone decarboxylase